MFVDASAIVAILTREEEADPLGARLGQAERPVTSPIAIFEATAAIVRKKTCSHARAAEIVARFLVLGGVDVVPITERESDLALLALERFGKGRHRAELNMGDCFAYACARRHGLPLLFKGDDFSHTHIDVA
jgi:ribonuclease VapC